MSNEKVVDIPQRYCVIGAGPSGLIAARALLRRGIEVDIVDRNPNIGGLWDINHADSPMYDTCNFISDKAHSGFIEFPMPESYPDYPRWDQILEYIRDFANAYDLTRRVECGLDVVSAVPLSPSGLDGWRVTFATGEERLYRGVIWACGQQHTAYMPALAGAETFTGEVIHSSQYKNQRMFSGRRVLVVGGGNSGVDIACDAAAVAAGAALSLRRGYWLLPKRLFGIPFLSVMYGEKLPPAELDIKLPEDPNERVSWILRSVGDYKHLGLPVPEESFWASHPTVNDQVTHYLAHGRLAVRPDIQRLDGDDVVFVDGTRETFDVVVLATGYSVEIPWLDPELVDWVEDQPNFHLGSMSRKVHGLYACGFVHFGGSTYDTWDKLFQVAVADIVADVTGEGSERAAQIRENYRPNLKGNLPLRKVHRNINQYDITALKKMFTELHDEFGIEMPDQNDLDFYPRNPAGAHTQ